MDASPFAPWANFYVIVGGAAAALTGLVFIVIVLGAELSAAASEQTASVFGTPNIVHFGAALLNSAILSAPWHRTPAPPPPSRCSRWPGSSTRSTSCIGFGRRRNTPRWGKTGSGT